MSILEISPLDDGGFKLSGELDLASARELRQVLLFDAAARGTLRLDLSELTFMDSSGLSAILDHARARNGAGPVVLVDPTPPVARVLELMSLDQHPGIVVRGPADDPGSTGRDNRLHRSESG